MHKTARECHKGTIIGEIRGIRKNTDAFFSSKHYCFHLQICKFSLSVQWRKMHFPWQEMKNYFVLEPKVRWSVNNISVPLGHEDNTVERIMRSPSPQSLAPISKSILDLLNSLPSMHWSSVKNAFLSSHLCI